MPDERPLKYRWKDAWRSKAGPHSTCRHLLHALAEYMDLDGGNCFPGMRTLEEETGLSRRTIIDRIRDLDGEWVRVEEREGGPGGKFFQYHPLIPAHVVRELHHVAGERGEGASPGMRRRGEGASPPMSERGETGSPRQPENVVREIHHAEPNVVKLSPQRGEAASPDTSKYSSRDPEEEAAHAAAAAPGGASVGGDEPHPFDGLLDEHPEALAVLRRMEHRGGLASTSSTIRARYLYPDGDGTMADPSVRGAALQERRRRVAAALLEMGDQGQKVWNARALAGFIRRLPPPGSGLQTGEDESARDRRKAEEARVRQNQTARDREAQEEAARAARDRRALAWYEDVDSLTRDEIAQAVKEECKAWGRAGESELGQRKAFMLVLRRRWEEETGSLAVCPT